MLQVNVPWELCSTGVFKLLTTSPLIQAGLVLCGTSLIISPIPGRLSWVVSCLCHLFSAHFILPSQVQVTLKDLWPFVPRQACPSETGSNERGVSASDRLPTFLRMGQPSASFLSSRWAGHCVKHAERAWRQWEFVSPCLIAYSIISLAKGSLQPSKSDDSFCLCKI